AVAASHHIPVIEDCAQAAGADYKGRRAGSLGVLGCFSFYPSKNLGAYGEGGAVTTHDPELAARCRRVRNHGQKELYLHTDVGYNFRLNSFQGAILSVKLSYLEKWTRRRNELALQYDQVLAGVIHAPKPCPDGRHAYHLYVARHPRRDAFRAALEAAGVRTAMHYPTPIHRQPVFERRGYPAASLPVTEEISATCVSLPLYPEMPSTHVERVAEAIQKVGGR
ncbi:MAG: DegT/DnrJ/EryC1/StrS family aminotransferase, partial [Candidatus Eisenbacteria bacterium]